MQDYFTGSLPSTTLTVRSNDDVPLSPISLYAIFFSLFLALALCCRGYVLL